MSVNFYRAVPITVIAVLLLAIACYFFWASNNPLIHNPLTAKPEEALAPSSRHTESVAQANPSMAMNVIGSEDHIDSVLHESMNPQMLLPHDVSVRDFKQRLASEIDANPPKLRELENSEIDAETAYRIYSFFSRCYREPRTPKQLDVRLSEFSDAAESVSADDGRTDDQRETHLEWLDRQLARVTAGYTMCSNIPSELDHRQEALHWLTEAKRLGHSVAEIEYYNDAIVWIMLEDDYNWSPSLVLNDPGLIDFVKAHSLSAITSALDKGHPEAYLVKSKAVLQGVIYPKDIVLAYAYLLIAEKKAQENQIEMLWYQYVDRAIAQNLTPDQFLEAEKLAHEMLIEEDE